MNATHNSTETCSESPVLFPDAPLLPPFAVTLLLITVVIAAWSDWAAWRIPNQLLAASLTSSLFIATFASAGVSIGNAFLGGLIGFCAFLPVYLLRGMGAGDVKLMAVVGTWTGPSIAVDIIFASALIGGAWAVMLWDIHRGGILLWLKTKCIGSRWHVNGRKWSIPGTGRVVEQISRQKIPYGAVIAFGTAVIVGIPKFTAQ